MSSECIFNSRIIFTHYFSSTRSPLIYFITISFVDSSIQGKEFVGGPFVTNDLDLNKDGLRPFRNLNLSDPKLICDDIL